MINKIPTARPTENTIPPGGQHLLAVGAPRGGDQLPIREDRDDKETAMNATKLLQEIHSNTTDEHGWVEGFQPVPRNWRSRGGYDLIQESVLHEDAPRGLAICEVVRVWKSKSTRYATRHVYHFLIGRNENGTAFAHAIPSHVFRLRTEVEKQEGAPLAVAKALAWIWDVDRGDVDNLRRNGDTALLPCVPPDNCLSLSLPTIAVLDHHQLSAAEILTDGKSVYARDAKLYHTRRQHPAVRVRSWSRVLIGNRRDLRAAELHGTVD